MNEECIEDVIFTSGRGVLNWLENKWFRK
jgi:hypothetical protein